MAGFSSVSRLYEVATDRGTIHDMAPLDMMTADNARSLLKNIHACHQVATAASDLPMVCYVETQLVALDDHFDGLATEWLAGSCAPLDALMAQARVALRGLRLVRRAMYQRDEVRQALGSLAPPDGDAHFEEIFAARLVTGWIGPQDRALIAAHSVSGDVDAYLADLVMIAPRWIRKHIEALDGSEVMLPNQTGLRDGAVLDISIALWDPTHLGRPGEFADYSDAVEAAKLLGEGTFNC
jgi:hypothetical protein